MNRYPHMRDPAGNADLYDEYFRMAVYPGAHVKQSYASLAPKGKLKRRGVRHCDAQEYLRYQYCSGISLEALGAALRQSLALRSYLVDLLLRAFKPDHPLVSDYLTKDVHQAWLDPLVRVLALPQQQRAAAMVRHLQNWPRLMRPRGWCRDQVDYYRVHIRGKRDGWRDEGIGAGIAVFAPAAPPKADLAKSKRNGLARWIELAAYRAGEAADAALDVIDKPKKVKDMDPLLATLSEQDIAVHAGIKDDSTLEAQISRLGEARGLDPFEGPAQPPQGLCLTPGSHGPPHVATPYTASTCKTTPGTPSWCARAINTNCNNCPANSPSHYYLDPTEITMFGFLKKKPDAPALNASQLVPRIKHLNFLRAVREAGAPEDEVPYHKPLCGELLVTYAFDLPDRLIMASTGLLKQAGVSFNDLPPLARANLERLLPAPQFFAKDGCGLAHTGGGMEATLLLVDKVWKEMQPKIRGDIIATAPRRDRILMCDSANPSAVAALRVQSQGFFDEIDDPHRLSTQLMVRRDGGWALYQQ